MSVSRLIELDRDKEITLRSMSMAGRGLEFARQRSYVSPYSHVPIDPRKWSPMDRRVTSTPADGHWWWCERNHSQVRLIPSPPLHQQVAAVFYNT